MSIYKEEKNHEEIIPREFADTTGSPWEDVDEEIARSNIKRLPWKMIIGQTLTSAISELRAAGHDRRGAMIILEDKIRARGFFSEEVLKKLRISVSARYGEQKSAEKYK